MGLLKKLELRTKEKTVRQGTKKSKVGGSKFEKELQKLECSVSYKIDSTGGRRGRKSFGELARVCQ